MRGESLQRWQSVATLPDLASDDIHLWQFSLRSPQHHINPLRALLSREEIARADRLLRPADRLRFTVGRARVRQLLGGYLATDPGRLELTTLPQGKPVLAVPALSFNLSHSADLALLAIARSVPLGVDLELVRPDLDWGPLSRRYFSRGEQLALQQLAPEQQLEAFVTIWSRKEAFLKATGSGFHQPFDMIEVSAPPAPAALLSDGGNSAAAGDWHLADIPIGPNYRAALAYPSPRRKVVLLELGPEGNPPWG